MEISVECRAGHSGEEIPCRLIFDGRVLDVADVIDRWLAIDHRYFKVRVLDGAICIVRHDELSGRWELIMFEPAPRARPARDLLH
jgi:hypothetical protein